MKISKSVFLVFFCIFFSACSSVSVSPGSGGSGGSAGTGGTSGTGGSSENVGTVDINQDRYDIGSPTLFNVYFSPTGSSDNDGLTPSTPLRYLNSIKNFIRTREGVTDRDAVLTLSRTGYQINLAPGTYSDEDTGHVMDNIQGTAEFPIIIKSSSTAQGGDAIVQTDLEFDHVKYLYLMNFTISRHGDALHISHSDHVLVSNMILNGGTYDGHGADSISSVAHDMFKVNQAQYIFFEDSLASGADDNVMDWVAVQVGHVVGNTIHNSHDWCGYVKGGSSYIVVENNLIYDCYNGGFTAGQGTGFEYMVAPWLFYETMDVKIINNVIHDTHGAGLGVAGGYNTLLAYNTLYKVGDDLHEYGRAQAFDIVHGGRECDHDGDLLGYCNTNLSQGGWGQPFSSSSEVHIPSKNIFIYNNIVYNPDTYNTIDAVFNVDAPVTTNADDSNIPSPSIVDSNLVIKGNFIYANPWPGHESSLFSHAEGCATSNTTCNATLVNANNSINAAVPQFQSLDPDNTHFLKPTASGNIFSVTTYSPPDFAWLDVPSLNETATTRTPSAGNLSNTILVDKSGNARTGSSIPGAYSEP
ncbi:MAG: right-handed parallel beta-helix repeat-containing protein [Deltaproteobacteria bacterium]|nr:MAG: right-handed parallel beta-helix repeat-containing protein [Deltaproteobacteria bacterium]